MELQECQLFTCHFCYCTAENSYECKRHEYYHHITDTLFPSSPSTTPEYNYGYDDDTSSEDSSEESSEELLEDTSKYKKQYIECVIKECQCIVVGKSLTRHVMYSHCEDNPPFQCKFCFKFFNNHVSVLYHATECTLGAINIYFDENELKLLKLCVNNKKGFNIYKESLITYLDYDIKYNSLEYNKLENDSSTFPEAKVGLSLKLIQCILNAFFKGKSLQRRQLEEVFSVVNRDNFDDMYHFFHSIASLFPVIFNALIPLVECCDNRYTSPWLCNCNRMIIYNLPAYNEKYNEIELKDDLPPLIQAPNGVYHYALNPNTFFVNGTHEFLKIINKICVNVDGIYGLLLVSAIYADIFEFMKMDDRNLRNYLINIGYDNDRDCNELITVIREKSFSFMSDKKLNECEKRNFFDDTILLPTCTFTDDTKAERLKNFIDEANLYYHSETFNGNCKKLNNFTLPSFDNINFKIKYKRKKISEIIIASRLTLAMKKIITSYSTVHEDIIEECLKKVDLTHLYICINNNNNCNISDTENDLLNDNENKFDNKLRNHFIYKIDLSLFEPDPDYEDDETFYRKLIDLKNAINCSEENEDCHVIKIEENINNNLDVKECNFSCIPVKNVPEKDQNYKIDMTINNNNNIHYNSSFEYQHNNFSNGFWNSSQSMNIQSSGAFNNNSINQYQSMDFYLDTNDNNTNNLQNRSYEIFENLSNHEMEFREHSISSIENPLYNQVNILNDNINLYYDSLNNVSSLQDICLQNMTKLREYVEEILQPKGKSYKCNKILNKSIQK